MGSHDSCEPSSFMHRAVFFLVLPILSYSAPPRFPLLPLRCPVTWQTYNPLRHGLMFWVYFFPALSAECCHSPTLFSLLSKFRSLDFVLSAVKGGGGGGLSTAWLCCFCGSHDVNRLNVFSSSSACASAELVKDGAVTHACVFLLEQTWLLNVIWLRVADVNTCGPRVH